MCCAISFPLEKIIVDVEAGLVLVLLLVLVLGFVTPVDV